MCVAVPFYTLTLRLHFLSLSSPMFFDRDDDNDGSNKIPSIHTISHEKSTHVMLHVLDKSNVLTPIHDAQSKDSQNYLVGAIQFYLHFTRRIA